MLEFNNLEIDFVVNHKVLKAIQGVSFKVNPGEIVALVGESGSGKSQTLMAAMGLLSKNGSWRGSIKLNGKELNGISSQNLNLIRGKDMGMIFQDPMTSLNPTLRIRSQMAEAVIKHLRVSRKEADKICIETLRSVGINDAERRYVSYPHEHSGGMIQRVMIAMALCCKPKIILADEPTTALDVTVQAQILDLFSKLPTKKGVGIILVTHDLGVVAEIADRVVVMYGGRIVEENNVFDLFKNPTHPYTKALMRSTPRLTERVKRLYVIGGNPPTLENRGKGCTFAPRCVYALDKCHKEIPGLKNEDKVIRACFRPVNEVIND